MHLVRNCVNTLMQIHRNNSSLRLSVKGFTLIELLMVVSIIAALAVASLAVAGRVKALAERSRCAANLRQIGVALQAYANEHDGNFPQTSHTTGSSLEDAWVYQLADYMGDGFDRIRVSPGDPKRRERLDAGGTSYILNSFLFVAEYDPFGNPVSEPMNKPSLIPRPGKTMVAFTISEDSPVGAQNDHTHSGRWSSWGAVLADISPDLHRPGQANDDHTRGSSNYLFADWHVETWKAKELKAKIDAGENPARPPEE